MQTVQDVLKGCTVTGTTINLPAGQLERKLYQDVAKSLELIGGKWKGGKIMGFIFPSDPSDLLEEIASGEKRNLKKEYQYFGTPASLAKEMITYADIQKGDRILEPSAGQGAIVKAIFEQHSFVKQVNCCELMPTNQMVLEKIDGTLLIADDFLQIAHFENFYNKIIANPPFAKNQDIDHIYKMWECLAPGGRIVTISSKHWLNSDNKKEKEFKNWIYNVVEADVQGIGAGVFSESGTKIETLLIIIQKLTA